MSQIERVETKSVLVDMATRYGMEPAAFEQTLRNTVFPKTGSKEEFAAFLLVAREYDLNPLLAQIYAFPKRGGGIQPIVPIDGWTDIINSNPALDGIEFVDHKRKGEVIAITCRIWRKDRAKPHDVTEYMAECQRDTEPWKRWPRRMLRHKALIQCARYAFGLAGIVEPDEAERGGQIDTMPPIPHSDEVIPPPPPKTLKIVRPRTDRPYGSSTDVQCEDAAVVEDSLEVLLSASQAVRREET